jgi:hypothetical protein
MDPTSIISGVASLFGGSGTSAVDQGVDNLIEQQAQSMFENFWQQLQQGQQDSTQQS